MTHADDRRLVAVVSGRVQGVGYRWFVRREAEHREVVGWVANRDDGGVEVIAEAPGAILDDLVASLEDGPFAASVDDVRTTYEPARGGMDGFEIRSGGHRGD